MVTKYFTTSVRKCGRGRQCAPNPWPGLSIARTACLSSSARSSAAAEGKTGVEALKPGSRVEFGVADGKRGPQALSIRVLDAPASVTKAARKPADDMALRRLVSGALLDVLVRVGDPYPAALAATDGRWVLAGMDRNGLRPSRYWVLDDGLVVMASEVGVIDADQAKVVRKGRLQPGRMFLIDTAKGRIVASGGPELALELERNGYRDYAEEAA